MNIKVLTFTVRHQLKDLCYVIHRLFFQVVNKDITFLKSIEEVIYFSLEYPRHRQKDTINILLI